MPGRLQHIDQFLEWQILVGVGAERCLLDPPEQFAETRIARKVRAQRQHVDKKADQTLGLTVGSTGDRGTHHHVALPAPSQQQNLERRQQHHE